MLLFDILKIFNITMGILFLCLYSYQIIFLFISLFSRPEKFTEAGRRRRFAFCIAARNEEAVIVQLLDSIRRQNYPSELIDVYVVADNCNDNTAAVSRDRGACVFSRQNDKYIGKGYALSFLFDRIGELVGHEHYDGYFIVDADNILDKNYVLEMNKCANVGHRIIMCYRNSKNYGDNWLSAGYSLWFMRASRQLNLPRQRLRLSCEVTGTGFYVCSEIIKKNGGWPYHCLVEDIEFSHASVLSGERIAFCYDAIVYDEQPTDLAQSVRQRKRWCRGYFEIMKRYGARLFLSFFRCRGFSNYDMIMNLSVALFISVISFAINLILGIVILLLDFSYLLPLLRLFAIAFIASYLLMLILGVLSGVCEWRRIHAKRYKIILYFFTFPLFIFSFLPIAFAAMLSGAGWEPVEHHPTDTERFN